MPQTCLDESAPTGAADEGSHSTWLGPACPPV
eukprot:CAMPEP_0197942228 /NCGR_PEP_ID=MMETSP1439-20131203/124041_1 /TAXON_ID=66791 /ORGANISM="Gonyaulax spinifera, Strain CCMP409" /LENGTH=31 /DNA_ID= /DNA_START= /DNA_END= /DNA_ORIENTATION=